jgi:hypothetical protein
MERIADALDRIAIALEAANASDPLAMLGAALEAGAGEGVPERVTLEPNVHQLGGQRWIATVPLDAVGMKGWSLDLAPDTSGDIAVSIAIVDENGIRIPVGGSRG